MARWICWACLVGLFGCAHADTLSGRIDGLNQVVAQAERNGAYRCAPRELALAKSHLEFARTELEQGDVTEAEDEFALAEPNAHAAYRLSPPERCSPRQVTVVKHEPVDTDGDGVVDSRDLCIVDPEDADGYLDADGCPDPDNDLDGIPDAVDRCPNDPEDFDGFQDTDGCPDADNDGDTIPDVTDACPNEPGRAEENGCPKVYKDVEVTTTQIRIHQQIHFETAKAKIRPVSFPILNTVAQVLMDYPDIRIEIQGHTDSRGSDRYNLRLSQARADSVMQYLIEHGIDPARMTSRGYGESMPIESNATAAGRAANRRVEFKRTDPGAVPSQAPPAGSPEETPK